MITATIFHNSIRCSGEVAPLKMIKMHSLRATFPGIVPWRPPNQYQIPGTKSPLLSWPKRPHKPWSSHGQARAGFGISLRAWGSLGSLMRLRQHEFCSSQLRHRFREALSIQEDSHIPRWSGNERGRRFRPWCNPIRSSSKPSLNFITNKTSPTDQNCMTGSSWIS